MAVLHGTVAPVGEGIVMEVHLDLVDAPATFLQRLTELGFADDPFLEFYPAEYTYHYTGRTRATKSEMRAALAEVNGLIEQTLAEAREAGVDLYAESELVREIRHFEPVGPERSLAGLEELVFLRSAEGTPAKADVHVEFRRGTVPAEVRDLLREKLFYWVSTPQTALYPSEEIATLQTSTFDEACSVFRRLVERPLPACTGIHLEQKLGMVGSRAGLRMPEVTMVTLQAGERLEAEGVGLIDVS